MSLSATLQAHDPTPWYRHRWPWLLIAGPAIVVVAGIVTAWLAILSEDGLVADDYYKRGLLINREIAQEAAAASMGLGAVLTIDAGGDVRVQVTRRGAPFTAAEAIELRLVHPTRGGRDHRATLQKSGDGTYAGRIEGLAPARWLVTLQAADWRLPAGEAVTGLDEVRLGDERAVR